jgi:hypothetical protein
MGYNGPTVNAELDNPTQCFAMLFLSNSMLDWADLSWAGLG